MHTNKENKDCDIWVDWKNEIVSFHETPGFERLHFGSEAVMRANLRILLTEGFLFQ